jgi:hypothetical protein
MITYNFGDGNVTSITEGLGGSSLQNEAVHTYNSGGTFSASAVLTDNLEGKSTDTCTASIIVDGPIATPSATATPTATVSSDTPTPTMAEAGPGATIIGLGAFFTALSLIGAVLFFAL